MQGQKHSAGSSGSQRGAHALEQVLQRTRRVRVREQHGAAQVLSLHERRQPGPPRDRAAAADHFHKERGDLGGAARWVWLPPTTTTPPVTAATTTTTTTTTITTTAAAATTSTAAAAAATATAAIARAVLDDCHRHYWCVPSVLVLVLLVRLVRLVRLVLLVLLLALLLVLLALLVQRHPPRHHKVTTKICHTQSRAQSQAAFSLWFCLALVLDSGQSQPPAPQPLIMLPRTTRCQRILATVHVSVRTSVSLFLSSAPSIQSQG
jgi:hypothetical protein